MENYRCGYCLNPIEDKPYEKVIITEKIKGLYHKDCLQLELEEMDHPVIRQEMVKQDKIWCSNCKSFTKCHIPEEVKNGTVSVEELEFYHNCL